MTISFFTFRVKYFLVHISNLYVPDYIDFCAALSEKLYVIRGGCGAGR